jgi:hypothetical protein
MKIKKIKNSDWEECQCGGRLAVDANKTPGGVNVVIECKECGDWIEKEITLKDLGIEVIG